MFGRLSNIVYITKRNVNAQLSNYHMTKLKRERGKGGMGKEKVGRDGEGKSREGWEWDEGRERMGMG